MRSSRRPEASARQLTDHAIGPELTTAWKSLSQSKAALRHIENRLEAAPGSGVVLDSVMDPKKKSSRAVRRRDGQHADVTAGSSKRRGRSQQSPEKSSSRSPLRNATQDSNVRRNNSVEFREPLASYREATPPPNPPSQLEAFSLQSSSSNPPSDPLLSQMVYHRDTRDSQTDRDQDSTRSSALEGTEVRFLNDRSALDSMRTARVSAWEQDNTPKPAPDSMRTAGVRVSAWQQDNTPEAQPGVEGQESSPSSAPGSAHREEHTPSSSPGSASQRLENLRRHQPDDKLEKLKERIRRQRQHLEEAAEREKLLVNLEQPDVEAVGSNNAGTGNNAGNMHKIIRKVAAAPPAPIYKGFNSTETKIQTPDGKVWKEAEFHNLSREIYRDLSRQFAESTRSRQQHQKEQRADRSRERRPPKPVRKVHRAAPSSETTARPAISPASWRDGQKLVKMVLGPVPKLPREEEPPADRLSRAASRHRSSSEPRSESNPRHRPSSSERPSAGSKSKSRCTATSTPQEKAQDTGAGTDLLSADIQGILDDLQLECRAAEREERARQRARGGGSARRGRGGSGSRTRTPVSAWGATAAATGSSSRGCRSASPVATSHHAQDPKKRHYDADSVRQYISRQQEERKRRQAEEKKAMKEEAERRNQRLKELYRKQREAVVTAEAPEAPEAPVQRRLQETYDKLLLEDSRLGEETQTQPAADSIHMRPMYQPSGESDKENKRLEAPQSPSSSDRSLSDQHPGPLSRNDLDTGLASLLQPERLSSSTMAPYGDHFLSHLLRMESAVKQRPTPSPSIRPNSKMSRIEALKATAASLSNRIESEARKIAGDGVNYDLETPMDVLRPSQGDPDAGSWAENDDVASRIQRILTGTGHTSSYNGTALPGAGHALRGQKDSRGTHTFTNNPHTPADETGPNTHERERLVNGLDRVERVDNGEYKNGTLDSSAGSISEGPLLSEGSFSEDDVSPPHPSSSSHGRFPRAAAAAERLEAAEYCAGQRKDYHRLSEFQREAARCATLSYTQHDSSKAPWEELNKGSPLSVINIYTKNLQGRLPGSERNPPSALPPPSANGPVDAAVYEDDFVSLHSSGASAQLKRGSNSRSVNSHFEELMRRSPYDKSTGGISSQHSSFHSSIHSSIHSSHPSSGSTPASSKHSARRIASDHSDGTLVEDHGSSCSPPSDALSSDSRRRASDKSSPNSQARSVRSNEASGEAAELSHHSKKSSALRHRKASPPSSGSPPGGSSPGEGGGSLGGNNPEHLGAQRESRYHDHR
ncbi:hypothetical protein CgunFtcFv8_027485 [Champsocephalus gunnari]|uniref:Centrosome-associated protein 350 n=1 Tax=Champsocephalus gunnari TaxID=52237 RepID=A0AAN8HWU4_CHAGU|nr:hypothetical protein CgunFtcFv8_027485 [Champsocephalus gunnari]